MKKIAQLSLGTNEQIDNRRWSAAVERLMQREQDLFEQKLVRFSVPFQFYQGGSYNANETIRAVRFPWDVRLRAIELDIVSPTATLGSTSEAEVVVKSSDFPADITVTFDYDNLVDLQPSLGLALWHGLAVHECDILINAGTEVYWDSFQNTLGGDTVESGQITLHFEANSLDGVASPTSLVKPNLIIQENVDATEQNTMFAQHASNLDLLDAQPDEANGFNVFSPVLCQWGSAVHDTAGMPTLSGGYVQSVHDHVDGAYVDTVDCWVVADTGRNYTFHFRNPAGTSLGSVTVNGSTGARVHGQISGLGETLSGDGYYVEVIESGSGSGYAAWALVHLQSRKGY